MEWTLTKGLQNLINQVNTRWPDRDKSTDGTVGDANHASGTSGHNPDDSAFNNAEWDGDADDLSEVRAWDMDADLRDPGTTTQELVDHIRHLPGVGSVLRYIIFNRKIYRSATGFAPEAYTGPSPHTGHVHFSGARSQAADENTTFNFRLEEVGDMGLTEAQTKDAAKAAFVEVLAEAYRAAIGKAPDEGSADVRAKNRSARNYRDFLRGVVGGPTEDDVTLAKNAILGALSSIGGITLTDAQVTQVAQAAASAIRPVEAQVASLREHLGDDE